MNLLRFRNLICGLGLALSSGSPALSAPVRIHFLTEPLPPYSTAQGGRAGGAMTDVLLEACRRLSYDCPVEVMPWRRALMLAERGEVGGIYTVVDTPVRRASFHVLVPVLRFRYAFFARKSDPASYEGPQSLVGRTLAAYGPSGTSFELEHLASGVSGANVQIETDNLTVLRKLAGGRYGESGLALINEDVAHALISAEHIPGLRVVGELGELAYTFGLSRAQIKPDIVERFNAVLTQLCREGVTQRIAERYGLHGARCP